MWGVCSIRRYTSFELFLEAQNFVNSATKWEKGTIDSEKRAGKDKEVRRPMVPTEDREQFCTKKEMTRSGW